MRKGEVVATRGDEQLIYDGEDERGLSAGHVRRGTRNYMPPRPLIVHLEKGFWDVPDVPVTAAGDSWRWQLRDKNGRWIEMGSEVKWLARGRWLHGIVIGSPAPGIATVEEAFTAIQHDIPSARLTVVRDAAELINRVEASRDEKGRIDWRTLDLGARSPLPAEVTEVTPKISPEQITAADLKPGDVYRRKHDNALVRVINVVESDSDYMEINGIILTGPTAGGRTEHSMKKSLPLLRQSAEPQDFERDVLTPVRERLDALKAKYPDGMAAAIDVALTMAAAEPFKSNPRFDELGRDPEVVRWMYQEQAVRARLDAAQAAGGVFSAESRRLEDELRPLLPHHMGGKILEYDKLLIEHRKAYLAWEMANESATNVITPHSDQAKEILGEVREIGRMVRLGVEVDLAQRSVSSPERDRIERNLNGYLGVWDPLLADIRRETQGTPFDAPLSPKAERLEARRVEVLGEIERLRAELAALPPDPSIDVDYASSRSLSEARALTTMKRRRELTRRTVATLAGVTTETKQTWVSKEPKAWVRRGEVHRALTKEEQDAMTAGLLAYPASWVERFDQNIYTTSMSERGWHSEHERHITLSTTDQKKPSEDGSASVWSTIFHEEGHGMEQVVPGLSGLEAMFWHDRMGEDSPKLLIAEDGARFPASDTANTKNVARRTPLRYTLKVYGNVYSKKQRSWEVFTTGVEEVLGTGKTQYTVRGADADLWDFTMGALLTLDGREKRG